MVKVPEMALLLLETPLDLKTPAEKSLSLNRLKHFPGGARPKNRTLFYEPLGKFFMN